MIGFNGGLIGASREFATTQSLPGVWSSQEQVKARRILSWPSTGNDPSFANVSLLLHGDGTNGSTTIIDNSPLAQTVTAFGNAQISTVQSKFGGSSILFSNDGADVLVVPTLNSLSITSGISFVVEAWVYLNSNRTFNHIVSKGTSGAREWSLQVGPTNISLYWSTNGSSTGDSAVSRAASLPLNTWMHIAAVVIGGATVKLFKDGIQQGSDGVLTSVYVGSGSLYVGRFMDYTGISHSINGHIDDLRITKGISRYTTDFTPPNTPFPNF